MNGEGGNRGVKASHVDNVTAGLGGGSAVCSPGGGFSVVHKHANPEENSCLLEYPITRSSLASN